MMISIESLQELDDVNDAELDALEEKLQRELARRSLLDFTTYTFPTYQVAPHLERLAEHLEAVERGDIKRLMVFMPPRHGKSELVSIRFPAWWLGRHPDDPIILTSYAASLAQSKSRQCRNLVEGRLFQNVFGATSCHDEPVTVDEAERSSISWRIDDHRGGMLAAGVGGGITGYGAKLFIIDDPHKNREEASSPTVRENVWEWYRSTARTRLEPDAAIILVMTRWHPEDLAAKLLALAEEDPAADQWVVLHLPAISDKGEALWPQRFPLPVLHQIKATIGSWEFGGLYQGDPKPPKGAIFDPDWFKRIERAPDGMTWVRYWDLAVSVKTTADYTASAAVAFDDQGNMYIRDVVRDRWAWHDARKKIMETVLREEEWFAPQQAERAKLIERIRKWNSKEHHKPLAMPSPIHFRHGVEQDIAGQILFQELMAEPQLRDVAVEAVQVEKDKLSRALPWSQRAEQKRVFLVEGGWTGGDWIPAFKQECRDFSGDGTTHDDQVDSVSGGVGMLGVTREVRYVPNPFYG